MAADFYENALRQAQSRNIEAATAEIYCSLDAGRRAVCREEQRRRWREMDEPARRSLHSVKSPRYESLTEDQKAPFRRAAEARRPRQQC